GAQPQYLVGRLLLVSIGGGDESGVERPRGPRTHEHDALDDFMRADDADGQIAGSLRTHLGLLPATIPRSSLCAPTGSRTCFLSRHDCRDRTHCAGPMMIISRR